MNILKLIICSLMIVSSLTKTHAQKLNLLIGTFTRSGKSEGIYVYEFDAATGKTRYKNKAAGLNNPSYLALSKNQQFVYAVDEAGAGKGAVSAFAFDKKNGALTLLNQKPSMGDGPCYVSTDKEGKHVFVANYAGGSFAALPILKDGTLGDAAQAIKFEPNGLGKGRQETPHAHSTILSPNEDYLFVSDLGNNEILGYKYASNAPQPLSAQEIIKPESGAGPRHFEFHPNKKFAYSILELNCTVNAYRYKDGKLALLQTISTQPEGFIGFKSGADIHVSPDGKFLYASNRGEANDLAIFSVQKNGKLISVGRQSTLGKTPRNFVIDPSGNFLLVAHQASDTVVIFKRNKKTGLLTDTGDRIEVGMPVCLKFGEAE